MRVCGIIAEFNPLHNGHSFLIQQARTQYQADYIIVIMSGDHVQRGEPAIVDKYERTKAALYAGADLVIELPVCLSTSSSCYFARGTVATLLSTGIVDFILFGSEDGELTSLLDAVNIDVIQRDQTQRLPNNQLGIEYIRAYIYLTQRNDAYSFFKTIKRVGTGYHDQFIQAEYCSASYLRELMFSETQETHTLVPPYVTSSLSVYYQNYRKMSLSEYETILYYALLQSKENGYSKFFDIYPDLSDKIKKNLVDYTTLEQFRIALKSKEITYSHINRALLHILLNIEKSTFEQLSNHYQYCAYLHVLGMNRCASELLHSIKQNCSVPLITKLADAETLVSTEALPILLQDINASTLYHHIAAIPNKNACIHNEYRHNIILVDFPRN